MEITLFIIPVFRGLEDLPTGLEGHKLLSLQLPSIPIMAAGIAVGAREFFLCYSTQIDFLFVVETEVATQTEQTYRPQYGANDNYDTLTTQHRVVWLYSLDSARAHDPTIAKHLKAFLPSQTQ